MYVYVASSWKNDIFPEVVRKLRVAGHEVYDFRDHGFSWQQIQPDYPERLLSSEELLEMYEHPLAREGLKRDMTALSNSDACVIVQPCGRSAHLEFGYAIGQGKITVALLKDKEPPDLMYCMADYLCTTIDEMLEVLEEEQRRL